MVEGKLQPKTVTIDNKQVELANPGARAIAFVIDWFVLFVVGSVVFGILVRIIGPEKTLHSEILFSY